MLGILTEEDRLKEQRFHSAEIRINFVSATMN
jgi:ATP-dependent RNA helicase DDX31/DBP7